jgi:hypothetical protein
MSGIFSARAGRSNAKPQHQQRAECSHDEADEIGVRCLAGATREIQVQSHRFEAEGHREADENKSNNLIPESPRRFQYGRYHVSDEFTRMTRRYLLPHTNIVTNGGY